MITSYNVNRQAAQKVAGFAGIDSTGKYIGVITQCEIAESKSGATYIELAFKANRWTEKIGDEIQPEREGDKMSFIKLFITSKTGERTFGADILDALMVACHVDSFVTQSMKVYNRDNTSRQGYRIPALERQLVGLLLQREDRKYVDQYGVEKEAFQMNIITPFDQATGKCAKEIIEGSEAKIVDNKLRSLKDKPAKPLQNAAQGAKPYDDAPPLADAPF